MRILQVSTADIAGGAERVAFGLFDRYRELGHESWLAVGTKRTRDPNVVTLDHADAEHFWYRLWTHVAAKLSPHIGSTKGAGRGKQWSEYLSQPGRWLNWQFGFPRHTGSPGANTRQSRYCPLPQPPRPPQRTSRRLLRPADAALAESPGTAYDHLARRLAPERSLRAFLRL